MNKFYQMLLRPKHFLCSDLILPRCANGCFYRMFAVETNHLDVSTYLHFYKELNAKINIEIIRCLSYGKKSFPRLDLLV